MRQTALSGLAGLVLALCAALPALAAPAPHYFMQGDRPAPAETAYGDNPACGQYADAGDARIYYEAYGAGQPVVVLHGGGVGTPYEMGALIDDLRQGFRTIVVSSRGHGRSEIGHSAMTLEQKAEDVRAVLAKEGITSARVVGFSDGAFTAYKLAAMYPGMVDRVVGIGAGTLEPGFFQGDLLISELEKADPAFVEWQRAIRPEPGRWQEFASNYMKFWGAAGLDQAFFTQIKAPVLLIVGDEDDHAPIPTVLRAHQALPCSSLLVVPKSWHTAFLDNYGVVRAALLPFLRAEAGDPRCSRKLSLNGELPAAK
ncbi:MAG: alpha/beta hydrolase [Succinivibrionaceae bacterium]|nr:alpha/beta hydrolase [Succinivibrionaceae bacterium]